MAGPARHQPCRKHQYFDTHATIMGQLRGEGFMMGSALKVTDFGYWYLLEGEIGCLGNIIIAVTKIIAVVGDDHGEPLVQTTMYSYNVSVRGGSNVFRYDNQHPSSLHPGHGDPHHKHEFDFATGDEMPGSPIWIGEDRWPLLCEVIQEARDWYYQNRSLLAAPDAYVIDLQSDLRD